MCERLKYALSIGVPTGFDALFPNRLSSVFAYSRCDTNYFPLVLCRVILIPIITRAAPITFVSNPRISSLLWEEISSFRLTEISRSST